MKRHNLTKIWITRASLMLLPMCMLVPPAMAITSLIDNFDENPAQLNYYGFSNWDVLNGSVDTIASGQGGFFIDCPGGTGICLDMDGTTNNAGDLVSKQTFSQGTYQLSFEVSGNQQPSGFGPDAMTVEFGDFFADIILNNQDPFKTYEYSVNVPKQGSKLIFSHKGGDTGGMILDNVSVIQKSAPPSETPPPVTTTLPPEGASAENYEQSTESGDPINSFTGELFFHEAPDLVFYGNAMPFFFQRYYASKLIVGGEIGNNWRHNFSWKVKFDGTSASVSSSASVRSPEGKVINFVKNNNTWQPVRTYYAPFQLTDAAGGNLSFNDPRNKTVYMFDGFSGNLVQVQNGHGAVLSLFYSGRLLSEISDGVVRSLTFVYANNKITQISDGTRTINYAYNADGDLISFTNALGKITNYTYDPQLVGEGKLVSRQLPAGNIPFTQTYKTQQGDPLHGRVLTQTDAAGNEITISYPADGGAGDTRIVNAEGNEQMHNYNASGELVSVSDAAATSESAGAKFSLDGNAIGQRAALTDRLGDTTQYSYHAASGKLASITHANGTSTRYSYTSRKIDGINYYDLSEITHADGSTQSFVYDQSGNLLKHTDQSGNLYTFTYNAAGQRLTATNPANGVTTQTYSADGSLATLTDPAGNATSFGYDASNRLNLITRPDTTTRAFSYDANDRLLTSSDGNDNITTLTWDQNGNLQTVKTPLDATTTLAYDDNDRLIKVTDPLGGVNSTSYDALGRVKTLTDANSNVTRLVYDAQSRPVSITDPLGNTWQTAYDLEGVPLSQTDPLDNTTTFTSNEMGWLIGVSSPLGNRTDFRYDEMGRLISTTDPLEQASKVSRDARGLITATTLPGDTITTAYARNSLGQITVTTDPNGNNWKRTFDSSGRQTSSSDPLDKQRSNSYDSMNRLSVVTYPGDLGTQTLSYDDAGNLTGRSYSDGTSINYRYNAENRLTAADGISISYDANGRRTETNGIGISYDSGGRIVSMTLAADKAVTYAYDANDRLISVTDWMGGVTNFSYDAVGRMTGMTRPNGINRTQSYDADSRLSSFAEGTVASSTFTRDANGQPTAVTRKAPLATTATNMTTRSNSYDAAAQIAGGRYDALGRLTAAGANSYTWDLASRLTAYTRNGSTIIAGYDAGGFRLSRRVGTSTREYVWNMAIPLPVVSIEKQDNTALRYYIHTPAGALLYSVDANSNARSFYHYDEMGNTLFISNDAGDTIATYAYTPYGELVASTGNLDNPFTWQGQFGVMDEGNNFYYIRARYYDANTGRFISRDVIKGKGAKSVNPYQYAFLNPLLFVDVDGREPSVVTGDRYRLRTRGVDTTRYACEASPSRDEGLSASTFSIGTIAFDTGISGLAKLNSLREAVNKPSAKVPVPDFDNDPLAKAAKAFSPTFDPVADEGLYLGFRAGKTRRIDAPKAQPKTPLQPKRSKTELNKGLRFEKGGAAFTQLFTDIFCTPEPAKIPLDQLNRELGDIESAGDDVDTAADDLQAIVVLA